MYNVARLSDKDRDVLFTRYPVPWVKYDTAVPGQFILVPNDVRIEELKIDYENMKEMLNDNSITFDQLMIEIKKIEDEINNLK